MTLIDFGYTMSNGHNYETLISRKRWELAQKCVIQHLDVGICHRMIPLRILYFMILTFQFQGQTYSCYAPAIKH